MRSKYCGKCGCDVRENSSFCYKCGAAVAAEGERTQTNGSNRTSVEGRPRTNVKLNKRLSKILLFSITTLTVVGWFAFQVPQIKVAYYKLSSTADIDRIANNSGLSVVGMAYFYSSNPKLVSPDLLTRVCPKEDIKSVEYGCYLPDSNEMYILNVSEIRYKEIEYVSAAHETLHAIWEHTPSAARAEIAEELRDLYNSNSVPTKNLRDSLKLYSSDQEVIDNELHSFVGSTISDSELTTQLEKHYNKYFDYRGSTVTAYSNFDSGINNELRFLDNEYADLIDQSNSIDQFKRTYLDDIKNYMDSIKYYDTYSYNRNVDIYNSNLSIYNRRVSQYNSARAQYNNNAQKFNNSLLSFYPTEDRAKVLSTSSKSSSF